MLSIRSAQDRGHAQQAWLDSYHSFSFADYYDPKFNSFRDLRVLNEDRIAPAKGFAPHPHRDMEILTYVLEGSLEHRDSLGNGGVLTAGEVQHISAGRGISHSEFNHSETEPLHLLQIWLLPNKNGVDPDYAQKRYRIAEEPDLKSLRLRSEEDILQERTPHSQGDGDRRPIDQRAECDGQDIEIPERNIRYNDPVSVSNGSYRQEDDKVEHSGDAGFFHLDTLLFLVALLLALHTYSFSRDYGLL